MLELVADQRARRENPSVVAAALADRPGEAGLDRDGQLVDVVAVEAEPGLEPQRVARTEAGRDHLGEGEQAIGDGLRITTPDPPARERRAGGSGLRSGYALPPALPTGQDGCR